MLSFYIIFRSRLLEVTMTEMYSKNHAVSYKLHVIKRWRLLTAMNCSFPVAQMVEHGASNAKIMGSIPRESKSW